MDKETIQQQIDILIETITEQQETMKQQPKYVPQIDMDLFLENIRHLYEYSSVLDKMNQRNRKIYLDQDLKPNTISSVAEEMPVMMHEKPAEDIKPKPMKEKKKQVAATVSLFEEDSAPVNDLRTLIGINEKFMFMNELFDGDLDEYNVTLDALNASRDASEAEQKLFLDFQPKFQWDMNSKAIKDLVSLFGRRFNS